jgi:hypothetical protein
VVRIRLPAPQTHHIHALFCMRVRICTDLGLQKKNGSGSVLGWSLGVLRAGLKLFLRNQCCGTVTIFYGSGSDF